MTSGGVIQFFENVSPVWATNGGATDPFVLAYGATLRVESMSAGVDNLSMPAQIWQNWNFNFDGTPLTPAE